MEAAMAEMTAQLSQMTHENQTLVQRLLGVERQLDASTVANGHAPPWAAYPAPGGPRSGQIVDTRLQVILGFAGCFA